MTEFEMASLTTRMVARYSAGGGASPSPLAGMQVGCRKPALCTGKRSVKPVWTWERANRTRASSTASTGLCPCAGRAPGPDRLAVRRCLPDCRNTRYRQDRTLTCTG